MKNLFLTFSGIFGAIPGLAVIQSGLGVPPNYNVLFGGFIEAFGVLTLLILWVNRNNIKKHTKKYIT